MQSKLKPILEKETNQKMGKVFFKRQNAPDRYDVSVRTLKEMAMERKGPTYYRVGKYVYYRVDEFEAWLMKHKIQTNE